MKKQILVLFAIVLFFTQCGTKTTSTTDNQEVTTDSVQKAENALIELHAVDLGLSVKWADCNLGAATNQEIGNLYAWGETEVKDNYSAENSLTWQKNLSDIAGDTIYDLATKHYGEQWFMPNALQFEELIEKCHWQWQEEAKGWKVTGPNGNSIFFPAADGKWSVLAWTSTPGSEELSSAELLAYSVSNAEEGIIVDVDNRYNAYPIRAITAGNQQAVDLGLSVKWADCNIGAESCNEYGQTYFWANLRISEKGNTFFDEPEINISGDPQYDVANCLLGKQWQMPTASDAVELIERCVWEWTVKDEKTGWKVTGQNGNSIFFAADDVYTPLFWTASPTWENRQVYKVSYVMDIEKPGLFPADMDEKLPVRAVCE